MAATLLRQGILLNPSPTASPHIHLASLPDTPPLVPSYSPLSSSASSSTSNHTSDADSYFLTAPSTTKPPSSPLVSPRHSPATRTYSAPTTRRIRFAPLPDIQRDDLPAVFSDDDDDNLNTPGPSTLRRPASATPLHAPQPEHPPALPDPLSPSCLLFSTPPTIDVTQTSPLTPTPQSSIHLPSVPPSPLNLTTPTPATAGEHPPGSRPHSPALTPITEGQVSVSVQPTPDLPPLSHTHSHTHSSATASPVLSAQKDKSEKGKQGGWTKKLLKPLMGFSLAPRTININLGNISTEDVLTLGVNQLFKDKDKGERGRARMRPDDASAPPSRAGSTHSIRTLGSGKFADIGVPLGRCQSEVTSGGGGTAGKRGISMDMLWRTQSLDLRSGSEAAAGKRTSVEGQGLKRVPTSGAGWGSLTGMGGKKRPSSAGGYVSGFGPGKRRVRMLNGRVYGARRGENPFENAATQEPEFVEWGYGGMGSVRAAGEAPKTGVDYAKVQAGRSAHGGSGGDGEGGDDGTGMAWVRRRREMKEKEKREREEAERNAALEKGQAEVEDAKADEGKEKEAAVEVVEEAEHVLMVANVPAPHNHWHHSHSHSHGHSVGGNERRGSAETARGVGVGVLAHSHSAESTQSSEASSGVELLPDEGRALLQSETESEDVARTRTPSASGTEEDEDEDGSASEDEGESEEERTRATVVGAGVEKISRHKEKAPSVSMAMGMAGGAVPSPLDGASAS